MSGQTANPEASAFDQTQWGGNAWDPTSQYGNAGMSLAAQKAVQNQQALGKSAAGVGNAYQQQMTGQGQNWAQQYGNFGQGQTSQYQGLGQQFGQQAQGYGQNYQGDRSQQQSALTNLQNAAAGNGPSAAQSVLTQGTDQGISAAMSEAASARGSTGYANAQKQGMATGAQLAQQGANSAAQLRAQEMQAAQQAYMQGSLGMGAQSLQAQEAAAGNELGAYGMGTQAGFQGLQGASGSELGYEQAGMQGQLAGLGLQQGYEGQGIGIQNAAAQTALGAQGLATQVSMGNAANNQSFVNALVGGTAGAAGQALKAGAAADADFQEPGNPTNAITLRETPFGLVEYDHATGRIGKLPLQPLNHHEYDMVVNGPHGAGPLDSPDRIRTVAHDMDVLGGPDPFDGLDLSGIEAMLARRRVGLR